MIGDVRSPITALSFSLVAQRSKPGPRVPGNCNRILGSWNG